MPVSLPTWWAYMNLLNTQNNLVKSNLGENFHIDLLMT